MNTFPQPGQASFQSFAGQAAPAAVQSAPPTFPTQLPPAPVAAAPVAAAPVGAFGPGAFAGSMVPDRGLPEPGPGDYRFAVERTFLKNGYTGRTWMAEVVIVHSTNPNFTAGMHVGFSKWLPADPQALKYAMIDIFNIVRAAAGFADETAFKTQMPQHEQLINACCDDKQQLPGNPFPANPLKGRQFDATIADSGSKKQRGTRAGQPILNWLPRPVQ